jgi:transposase
MELARTQMDISEISPFLNKPLPDTIDDCHKIIIELREVVKYLFQKIKEFEKLPARIEKLEAENRALQERLNLNSKNSSKPPSSDHKKNKKQKKSNDKASGGQKGHPGHHRELLDVSKVDDVVVCEMAQECEKCSGHVVASNDYFRHQVYELPEIKLFVTEYQLKKGVCLCCGHRQKGKLPEGINRHITGPRLIGFMSLLVSEYQVSRRQLQQFLSEYFDFRLSLGTIFNKQRLVNSILKEPVNGLLSVIKQSHCNMDETSHSRAGERQWVWEIASKQAAYFEILPSRGKKVVKSLMEGFKNIVTTDRYCAYNHFDSSQRQICWSHLKRDFTKFSERKDKIISRIGKELVGLTSDLFDIWHEFKSGKITREMLNMKARSLRKRIGEELEKGSYTAPELRMSRFCKNLLNYFHALWTFLEVEGVEPTNNHAERCLRPLVIWRKKYFCTHSDYGSEFVGRSASLIATCKMQSINTFEYLTKAVNNHFSGAHAPPIFA